MALTGDGWLGPAGRNDEEGLPGIDDEFNGMQYSIDHFGYRSV